ncbi:putative Phosphatidylinositol-4-phosphate 5-kinase [Balamuthia mandrillaris]
MEERKNGSLSQLQEENRLLHQELEALKAKWFLYTTNGDHKIPPSSSPAVAAVSFRQQQQQQQPQFQKMHAAARQFFRAVYYVFHRAKYQRKEELRQGDPQTLRKRATSDLSKPTLLHAPIAAQPPRARSRAPSAAPLLQVSRQPTQERIHANLHLRIGSFQPRAALSIKKLRNADLVKQLQEKEQILIASKPQQQSTNRCMFDVAFRVKSDADDFELGELSGCIQDILTVVSQRHPCSFKVRMSKEGGHRLFHLHLSMVHPKFAQMQNLLDGIETLKVTLESLGLAQYNGDTGSILLTCANNHYLNMKCSFRKSLLHILNESASKKTEGSTPTNWLLRLLELLQLIDADLEFNDVLESLKFLGVKQKRRNRINERRKSVKAVITDVLCQPQLHPVVKAAYFTTMELLEGPHSLHVLCPNASDALFSLGFEGFSLAELLPTKEHVEEGPPVFSFITEEDIYLLDFIKAGMERTVRADIYGHSLRKTKGGRNKKVKYIGRLNDHPFVFTSFAPQVFAFMLQQAKIAVKDYSESFHGLKQIQSEGRSGSSFFLSADKRILVKTITKGEFRFLRSILASYINHIRVNPSTLICQILGLYALKFGDRSVYFMAMLNAFATEKPLAERYDLKGSSEGRSLTKQQLVDTTCTRRDLEFTRMLHLGPRNRALFLDQLQKDCEFLEGNGIMDYSLLVGIHQYEPNTVSHLRCPFYFFTFFYQNKLICFCNTPI